MKMIPGLKQHPKVDLGLDATPIQRLSRLGEELGVDLWVKRDDCTSLTFGGNKVRQLEYYLGPAAEQGA
ncbi:MAG: pyridoxal-phosphate dependent enzyme, partial [Pseudomonadota bacterium]